MSEEKKDEFIENEDNLKEDSNVKDTSSKKELVIDEKDEEMIKEEVKKVKEKRKTNHLKSFKKDKASEKNIKNHPINKFLVLLLFVVIAAVVVAGYMALSYFNVFKGDKISRTMFEGTEVVELDGQTWILQDEVKVTAEVFTSADCEECNVEGLISLLKKEMPTIEITEKSVEDGATEINYVPAVFFDENITKTDFYNRAKDLFTEENGKYVLHTAQLGFPVKSLGELTDDIGFTVGDEDAGVSVIAVTDFGCEKCVVANPVLDKLEVEYRNEAKFTYKVYTDTEDERMMSVSMAAFCADEQGEFDAYADNLFARQSAWMAVEGDLTTVLENYATNLKLDKAKFSECLTSKKYEDDLVEMNKEIMDFGFTSVPVYFIDGERIDGVPTYEEMSTMLKK